MAEETTTTKAEFNVLNHDLVPVHELLSDEESRLLLETLNINPMQLPKILASDPAAMAVNARANQVVRVRRKSRTAGEAIAYRLVIEYPM